MKKILVFAMAFTFVLSLAAGAMAQKPLVKVPTCWMDSSEAFNIWYAKKMGWDKAEGLDIEMISFGSGPAQMEALPAKQWVLGGTGVGGTLIGGMRYGIYLVGGANAEDDVNAFYVRKDSPILKKKGFNPDYPDVYGTPETVKGSTILLTSQTTVHYIIGKWLEILGLKESDVKITNMEMPSIVAAFEKGIGDVASVWAPVTFQAESRGWVKAGSTGTTKAYTATVLVGDKDWCDKNPETTAKFLRVYYPGFPALEGQGIFPRDGQILSGLHERLLRHQDDRRGREEGSRCAPALDPGRSEQAQRRLQGRGRDDPLAEPGRRVLHPHGPLQPRRAREVQEGRDRHRQVPEDCSAAAPPAITAWRSVNMVCCNHLTAFEEEDL